MAAKRFTEQVETYTVLILRLDEYKASERKLPAGFEFASLAQTVALRKQERKVLQQLFDDWEIPYCHRLRGWRQDSPIFVVRGGELAGGVYLCDQNEFDDDPTSGQIHYVFTAPRFQGNGIYSVIFGEAVKRAQAWGLEKIYFNTDRHLLPEVHLRWGGKLWKVIPKPSRLPQNGLGRALRSVRRYAQRMWQGWRSPCD